MKQKILSALFSVAMCGSAMAQNEVIKLNQVGFDPNGEKTASIECADKATASKVTILDANGKKVWKGNAGEGRVSAISNKVRSVVDFSSLNKEGEYTLVVQQGKVKSEAKFVVKNNPLKALSAASIQGFYFQRAAMPIEEQYVGKWARPAGHMDTNVMVHPSAATAERPAGTVISSSWGWYDAGDYNKYIVNSGFTVGVMLGAYEQNKEYYKNLVVNIPEQNNNVPDLLDEIYYNLKWMQTMQDTDGGLYHKLTTPFFEGFVAPSECHQQRYVVKKTTPASLDFAASMAMASRIYKEYESAFPGFSAKALEQAEKAYAWAKANPNEAYDQNKMNAEFDPDVSTGAYDDKVFTDEFFWAATELYFVTGKDIYRSDALENMPKGRYVPATWGCVAELGVIEWARQKNSSIGDTKIASDMKEMFLSYLSHYKDVDGSCFNSPYGNDARDFFWGCNSEGCAWRGIQMMYAYDLTGDAVYRQNAQRCMNYLLGQNATGYCYVTGFGTKPSVHPHQRLAASNPNGAYPGFLVGGPNPGQQDKGDNLKYNSNIPDESYMDNEGSYASNEIAINWNATLVALAGWLDR